MSTAVLVWYVQSNKSRVYLFVLVTLQHGSYQEAWLTGISLWTCSPLWFPASESNHGQRSHGERQQAGGDSPVSGNNNNQHLGRRQESRSLSSWFAWITTDSCHHTLTLHLRVNDMTQLQLSLILKPLWTQKKHKKNRFVIKLPVLALPAPSSPPWSAGEADSQMVTLSDWTN